VKNGPFKSSLQCRTNPPKSWTPPNPLVVCGGGQSVANALVPKLAAEQPGDDGVEIAQRKLDFSPSTQRVDSPLSLASPG
jgi:hypothetical protein